LFCGIILEEKFNKENMKGKEKIIIYQSKTGKIEFRGDFQRDTIWGSLNQMADLFNVKKPAISKHLKNVYKEGELNRKSTVSILETVQREGKRRVVRKIEYYNLDAIISVGYRINSKKATQFRVWATKTLKQHLLKGYTINKKQINKNYQSFVEAISNVKAFLPEKQKVGNEDVLELVNVFASTWFSLDAYDKEKFPKKTYSKKRIKINAEELENVLQSFKEELKKKKQATELFGQEREKKAIKGIMGSVFQSLGGKDVYPSIEEKSAHILYFIIKNHPFVDGNKRSAAFSFVWFLRKVGLLRATFTPQALTALTILIAESNPRDKDKMIKLVLLLLGKENI
jgi:prophage maintenance system killer protein